MSQAWRASPPLRVPPSTSVELPDFLELSDVKETSQASDFIHQASIPRALARQAGQACLLPTELDPTQGQKLGSADSHLTSSIHQAPWPLQPVVPFSALQHQSNGNSPGETSQL